MRRFSASVANLLVLEAPNRVDGRDKHDHDAKPPRANFSGSELIVTNS